MPKVYDEEESIGLLTDKDNIDIPLQDFSFDKQQLTEMLFGHDMILNAVLNNTSSLSRLRLVSKEMKDAVDMFLATIKLHAENASPTLLSRLIGGYAYSYPEGELYDRILQARKLAAARSVLTDYLDRLFFLSNIASNVAVGVGCGLLATLLPLVSMYGILKINIKTDNIAISALGDTPVSLMNAFSISAIGSTINIINKAAIKNQQTEVSPIPAWSKAALTWLGETRANRLVTLGTTVATFTLSYPSLSSHFFGSCYWTLGLPCYKATGNNLIYFPAAVLPSVIGAALIGISGILPLKQESLLTYTGYKLLAETLFSSGIAITAGAIVYGLSVAVTDVAKEQVDKYTLGLPIAAAAGVAIIGVGSWLTRRGLFSIQGDKNALQTAYNTIPSQYH